MNRTEENIESLQKKSDVQMSDLLLKAETLGTGLSWQITSLDLDGFDDLLK